MNQDSLLHRQVHPNFRQSDGVSIQAFTVTSQVFTPTSKDDGKLSVYNGEKFTAKESYEHYIKDENKSSCGVLSVTPLECIESDLTSTEDNNPFDGHSYIDYEKKSKGEVKSAAQKLKIIALARGWQHQSED